jgi:hypothetical protein
MDAEGFKPLSFSVIFSSCFFSTLELRKKGKRLHSGTKRSGYLSGAYQKSK